jgi:hypothetical protein
MSFKIFLLIVSSIVIVNCASRRKLVDVEELEEERSRARFFDDEIDDRPLNPRNCVEVLDGVHRCSTRRQCKAVGPRARCRKGKCYCLFNPFKRPNFQTIVLKFLKNISFDKIMRWLIVWV